MIDKAEYIANYLSQCEPLVWASDGTLDVPEWIQQEEARRLEAAEQSWQWVNSQHPWSTQ